MKRVLCATCLALACAVGLSAQAQLAGDDQKKSTTAAKPAESSVTMTGCLRAGDTPNSFVLANVKTGATKSDAPAPPANPPTDPVANPAIPTSAAAAPPIPGNPPATPTTPPTAASAPVNPDAAAVGTSGAAGPDADTIRLIGAPPGLDLKAHVGHTVKITGSLTPASAKAKAARSIHVKSFEHVAGTCK